MKNTIFAIIAFMLFLQQPSMALQEDEINLFMQTNIDQATTILRDDKIKKNQKAEKIFAIFDPIFDYTLMARLAIGSPEWTKLTQKQQGDFSKIFEQKLKVAYMEKLDLYTDEKIVIKSSDKIKDSRIHLTTHLIKNKEVYEVIYKFYKDKHNVWMIYDVDILGVSIIQTYRTQFADILAKESFDKLLEKLKTQGS